MGKIPVNCKILRSERKNLNYTKEEVAYAMKTKVERIVSWEEGKDFPTYAQLERLAYKVYKRPIAVFFFPEPPAQDTPNKAFRTLPKFRLQELSPSFIKLFRWACMMRINLEELCEGKNPAQDKVFKDIQVISEVNINSLTDTVRTYLGVELGKQIRWQDSKKALSNWRSAVEEKGVFIFRQSFKEKGISGFCLYDSEFPIIYINSSMPKTRQIFTIFHELAHLLFGTGGVDYRVDEYHLLPLSKVNKTEIFCNQFASAFLVPDRDFDGRRIGPTDDGSIDDTVTVLANRYSVSREVILRKLRDRKLIDQKCYDTKTTSWREEFERGRKREKEKETIINYYNVQKSYFSSRYLDLAFARYYKTEISEYQLADYLNIKVDRLSRLETAPSKRG